MVDGCEEFLSGLRVVCLNVLKIAESIQFGVVPNENFNSLHAAMA
jgi:hypothetical protein